MAITLKYGASPAALAAAGYAAGVGRAKRRQTDRAMPLMQQYIQQRYDIQRRFQEHGWDVDARKAAFGQQKELQQLGFDQQGKMQQAAFDQQGNLQDARFGQQQELQEGAFDNRRQLHENQWEREDDLHHRDILQGIRSGELEFPPAMQAEWNRLEDQMARVENNPMLDEAQKEQAQKQLKQRAVRVLRSARPPMRKQPTIEEAVQSDTHRDEEGNIWGFDKNGRPMIIRESQSAEDQKTFKAQLEKDHKEAQRRLEHWRNSPAVRSDEAPPTIPDLVDQVRRERDALHRRFQNNGGGGNGGAGILQPPPVGREGNPDGISNALVGPSESPMTTEDRNRELDQVQGQLDQLPANDQRRSALAQRKNQLLGIQLAQPQSKEDYDRLPSGMEFIDPNGMRRRKP